MSRVRRAGRALALLALCASSGVARAQADKLPEHIATIHQPMTVGEKGPEGPGADFLVERGRASEFFLLGESHGNVETPRLTSWLMQRLAPAGYSVLAVETGPVRRTSDEAPRRRGAGAGRVPVVPRALAVHHRFLLLARGSQRCCWTPARRAGMCGGSTRSSSDRAATC